MMSCAEEPSRIHVERDQKEDSSAPADCRAPSSGAQRVIRKVAMQDAVQQATVG